VRLYQAGSPTRSRIPPEQFLCLLSTPPLPLPISRLHRCTGIDILCTLSHALLYSCRRRLGACWLRVCCSVSPSLVDQDDRSLWCQANINTCVDLCGGQANIASNGNECTPVSRLSAANKCAS
jgi:hypothetical protein